MLTSLKPLLYIQISPERVAIKNIRTGAELSELPELATSDTRPPQVLGIGRQARVAVANATNARLTNPFAHPRSLASDFTSAELLLKSLVAQAIGKSFFAVPPKIVMHPMGSPDGGFTQIEKRAFREMGLGAGASEVEVWTGRELTGTEVKTKDTPPDAGEWSN